jgi:hypothetical protein
MFAALTASCGLDDSGAPGPEHAFATSRSSDRERSEIERAARLALKALDRRTT